MQKRVTQLIGSIANEAIISELYLFFGLIMDGGLRSCCIFVALFAVD
jgi:hypothetical protein